jgi:probable HAF family extracellular repeat protein
MSRIAQATIIFAILAAVAIPGHWAAASAGPSYIAIDVGTLGGPNAILNVPGFPITSQGGILGTADTTIADTDYPNFNPTILFGPDPVLAQAFEWRNGHMTNLGALPGNNSSSVFQVNSSGVGVGASETAIIDPLAGYPAEHAVMYRNGHVVDLGTLPGGSESQACCITDSGLVAGFANNGIPDPYTGTTQGRGFVWQNGVMRDIGSLGGPDTGVSLMNNLGQVVGSSYTNDTPNATTGQPTADPYLWQNGTMHDLGTLGGTIGSADIVNLRGEAAGTSDLAGDQTWHGFLWSNGTMHDLGTLGGDTSQALWMNNAGEVVGRADLAGSQIHYGFLWTNGKMTGLMPVDGATCSNAFGINDGGQVVGTATDCHGNILAAVLWENGSAYDLNTLSTPSGLTGIEPAYIDNRGEIVCWQFNADGTTRVVVLIPSGLAASEGITAPRASSAPVTATRSTLPRGRSAPNGLLAAARSRLLPWSQRDTP